MKVHMKVPTRKRVLTFECDHCDKVYYTKYSLNYHQKRFDFECEICQEKFVLESLKKIHIKDVHEERQIIHKKVKNFKCGYCKSSFSTNSNMAHHLLTKHKG